MSNTTNTTNKTDATTTNKTNATTSNSEEKKSLGHPARIVIRGVHSEGDVVETKTSGTYYFKNGYHFIFYTEKDEKEHVEVTTRMIIKDRELSVERSGDLKHRMVYELGEVTGCDYQTPMGIIPLEIRTHLFEIQESQEKGNLQLHIEYTMGMNGGEATNSSILLTVNWDV